MRDLHHTKILVRALCDAIDVTLFISFLVVPISFLCHKVKND